MDQVSEGETKAISIFPISYGYKLPSMISGVPVTMLLDTGAAVSLLRRDVWIKVSAQLSDLQPWSGATLVSAGGGPLTIYGCACIDFVLGGRNFQNEFVVVSPLTSEAILGIDFLQEQQAAIDLGQKQLCLRKGGCDISLDIPTSVQSC